jgi:hypothetical protein
MLALGCNHVGAPLEENLLPSSFTWLLADVRRPTSRVIHMVFSTVFSQYGRQLLLQQTIPEKARERTQGGSLSLSIT